MRKLLEDGRWWCPFDEDFQHIYILPNEASQSPVKLYEAQGVNADHGAEVTTGFLCGAP